MAKMLSEGKVENLEKLTDKELVALALREMAFTLPLYHTFSIFAEKDDFGKPNKSCLLDKNSEYLKIIRPYLIGKRVIDLGAGGSAIEHERVLRELFGVEEYVGVDFQSREGCVESDALLFLDKQSGNSSLCMAFGLLNEPIFGEPFGSQGTELTKIRNEYARRLANQIYRVTLPEGVFFGKGIDGRMGDYLEEVGFENYRKNQLSVDFKRIWECIPFIFRKGEQK